MPGGEMGRGEGWGADPGLAVCPFHVVTFPPGPQAGPVLSRQGGQPGPAPVNPTSLPSQPPPAPGPFLLNRWGSGQAHSRPPTGKRWISREARGLWDSPCLFFIPGDPRMGLWMPSCSSPGSLQLEKAHALQQRCSAVKTNKCQFLKRNLK